MQRRYVCGFYPQIAATQDLEFILKTLSLSFSFCVGLSTSHIKKLIIETITTRDRSAELLFLISGQTHLSDIFLSVANLKNILSLPLHQLHNQFS